MDPVTIWEKLDAGGAALSSTLAGVAGYIAYQLIKVESKRDLRADQVLRSQQAATVGIWLDDNRMIVANYVLTAIVANHSPAPIYDVRLTAWPHPDVAAGDPSDPTICLADEWHAIPPGTSHDLDVTELMEHDSSERLPRIEILFPDNANRRWARDGSGILKEIGWAIATLIGSGRSLAAWPPRSKTYLVTELARLPVGSADERPILLCYRRWAGTGRLLGRGL